MALATLAEYRQYVAVAQADEALVTRLLAAASAWFEKQVDRKIASATYTDELHSGDGSQEIVPCQYPVTSVTTVTIDGEEIPKAIGTAYGWVLMDSVIYLRGYRADEGRGNIAITYVAGFSAVPEDIKQAVIETAAERFEYRNRIGQKTSISVEGTSVSFASFQIPVSVKSVIESYAR